ncbi:uncharacterized protein LOC129592953 [Paramacrobiotus metropolitanus]|uniref:uncharacterized protein LOC129592953 n=1 Tax=Paramacrobiotus metropolitanus TaxID=2943436 RepID=UPI00244637A5|nr:uncharacterized protein LOC129592953 [Paramacrobiotus metropolitanus]
MNATPLHYGQLGTGTRELNYGNTVLVQRDHGQWWLGYVQDIDGDHFYIDFDATTVNSQWIHARHLWPHQFLRNRPLWGFTPYSVQVALRDADSQPLIFRPGAVIHDSGGIYRVVSLNDGNPRHMVHRAQLVEQLPTSDDGQSFFERQSGFLYRKHVIRFAQANLLPPLDFLPIRIARTCRLSFDRDREVCYASCCYKIKLYRPDHMLFVCSGQPCHRGGIYEFNVGCRVFVRVGTDAVTFICAEVHGDASGRSMFWDKDSLTAACGRYLAEKVAKQQMNIVEAPMFNLDSGKTGFSTDVDEMLNTLPHSLMAFILGSMDINTQSQFRRVCALWNVLLPYYSNNRHIIMALKGTRVYEHQHQKSNVAHDCGAYNLVTMLSRVITRDIQTLAFVVDEPSPDAFLNLREPLSAIKQFLQAKEIRVTTIIVRNGYDVAGLWPYAFLKMHLRHRNGKLEYDLLTASVSSFCSSTTPRPRPSVDRLGRLRSALREQ